MVVCTVTGIIRGVVHGLSLAGCRLTEKEGADGMMHGAVRWVCVVGANRLAEASGRRSWLLRMPAPPCCEQPSRQPA